MGERKAVTGQLARRYHAAGRAQKAVILTELCALTGWHRDHARKALRRAYGSRPVVRQRKPRDPYYGVQELAALRKVWAILDAPAGKRLAPFLPEIVDRLIACGELDLTDEVLSAGADVGRDDRPQAGRGPGPVEDQGTPPDQAGKLAQIPDPDPDLA